MSPVATGVTRDMVSGGVGKMQREGEHVCVHHSYNSQGICKSNKICHKIGKSIINEFTICSLLKRPLTGSNQSHRMNITRGHNRETNPVGRENGVEMGAITVGVFMSQKYGIPGDLLQIYRHD